MRLDSQTEIIKATMINADNNEELLLFEKEGSRCHFRKEFEHQGYIISLRLDWGDVVNGEPKLDADIWRKSKNKNNRLRNGEWHHTTKEFDEKIGVHIYLFEFQNLRLRLATRTTVGKRLSCSAVIVKPSQKGKDNPEN